MALTFTRAPTVAPGQLVTSTEHVKLSAAFNDRLRSGVGDCTFRIHQLLFNSFRQVLSPDGLAFHALGEFFERLIHIDPAETSLTWPGVEPGLPDGPALASQMMAFIFGNAGEDSEAGRLAGLPLWLNGVRPPATPAEKWLLGKQQRGVYDPVTGLKNIPAFKAAQAYFRIQQPARSPHGKSYGSYLPVPEIVGNCEDESPTNSATPVFELFFTALHDGVLPATNCEKAGLAARCYQTYCPLSPEVGKVVGISYLPFAYHVWFVKSLNADGSIKLDFDRLDLKDYIEGPYTAGGSLRRDDGGQLPRLLNIFLQDFRGSAAQRDGESFSIENIGFDYDAFFRRQYLLAPNIAHVASGILQEDYPLFVFSGAPSLPPGAMAAHSQSGTDSHAYANGYVLASCFVKSAGLIGNVEVEVLGGGVILDTLGVSGGSDFIRMFDDSPTPKPLQFRLKTAANFTSATGSISIECTELLDYRPEIHDAYLVTRCASATAGAQVIGQRGGDVDSRAIADSYFADGIIFNANTDMPADSLDEVNVNPVFESARKFIRDNTRIVKRSQFVGYEVSGGKSILYFKRYQPLGGLVFDVFDGITPADGSGEGIIATAKTRGFTNEWLMFAQFKPHGEASSQFAPEKHADYFTWANRCQFYNSQLTSNLNPDLLQHFAQGLRPPLAPEAPPGYNYAGTSNTMRFLSEDQKIAFYKSCRVYEPDSEIESATIVHEAGEDVVKLTMKTRLPSCAEAPAAVPRDVSMWNIDALRAEPYRTFENGLRDYLVFQTLGQRCPRQRPGDTAANSNLWTDFDGVGGCCFPHFFFTRLIPVPYEDDNDTVEAATDTMITSDRFLQMEFYLRAMCEGFVDGQTSSDTICRTYFRTGTAPDETLFDYTFPNLCFDAFGGRWLNTLPTSIRKDKPQGFGPLPDVFIYAEIINQIAKSVNKLDKARLMLPHLLRCQTDHYSGSAVITPDWPSTSPERDCFDAGNFKASWSGSAPPVGGTPDSIGPVEDCAVISAKTQAGFDGSCASIQFNLRASKDVVRYQFQLDDPLAINAIPEKLRELANTAAVGFLALSMIYKHEIKRTAVNDSGDASGCCLVIDESCAAGFFFDAGSTPKGYSFKVDDISTAVTCGLFQSGSLDAGELPSSDYYAGRNGGVLCVDSNFILRLLKPFAAQPTAFITIPIVA